ncbi:MAG: sigma-70 family RNA polymerase sigma factor [Bradymonadia bacterium]
MKAPSDRAVTEAYRALGDELSRFIGSRVQGPVVDDLVQEVFLRLHTHLAEQGQITHLRGWLYQVARNVVSDHHRQASRAPHPVGLTPEQAPEHVETQLETELEWSPEDRQQFVAMALKVMIDTLPPDDAEALRLVEIEGRSQQALAEHLGISPSGARSRVQRARKRLKAQLEACCALAFDQYGGVTDCAARSDELGCECR